MTEHLAYLDLSDTGMDFTKLPLLGFNICIDGLGSQEGLGAFGSPGQSIQPLLRAGVNSDRKRFGHERRTHILHFHNTRSACVRLSRRGAEPNSNSRERRRSRLRLMLPAQTPDIMQHAATLQGRA